MTDQPRPAPEDKEWLDMEGVRDTAKLPTHPRPFRDRPVRQVTSWPQVAVLAIVMLGMVGVCWAIAWAVR